MPRSSTLTGSTKYRNIYCRPLILNSYSLEEEYSVTCFAFLPSGVTSTTCYLYTLQISYPTYSSIFNIHHNTGFLKHCSWFVLILRVHEFSSKCFYSNSSEFLFHSSSITSFQSRSSTLTGSITHRNIYYKPLILNSYLPLEEGYSVTWFFSLFWYTIQDLRNTTCASIRYRSYQTFLHLTSLIIFGSTLIHYSWFVPIPHVHRLSPEFLDSKSPELFFLFSSRTTSLSPRTSTITGSTMLRNIYYKPLF